MGLLYICHTLNCILLLILTASHLLLPLPSSETCILKTIFYILSCSKSPLVFYKNEDHIIYILICKNEDHIIYILIYLIYLS